MKVDAMLAHRAPTFLRAMRGSIAAFALCVLAAVILDIAPVRAYQAPLSISGRSTSGGTFVLPNGYNVSMAMVGTNIASDTTLTSFNSLGGPSQAFYSPSTWPLSTPAISVQANLGGCPAATSSRQNCANRGTITYTFPQPVRNPVLHFGGLGGNVNNTIDRANHSQRLTIASALNGATPVAATWTELASNSNFSSTATSVFSTIVRGNTSCSMAVNPAACGSMRLNGTVTTLVLNVSMDYMLEPFSGPIAIDANSVDAIMALVTVDEDFGDAPASYDSGQAAVHVLSDLSIGGSVTADNVNVQAATSSPNASATASADTDDFVWPSMSNNTVATVSVPISNASKSGTLCGWVDFDNSGTFAAGEGVCQTFLAGATSVNLSFAVPAAAVTGNRVARLRVDYGSELATSTPTGRADSGEVEDALVQVIRPTLTLRKVSLGGVGGFSFSGNNGVQAQTLTTVTAGTPVSGATQTLTTASTVTTVTEAVPVGWSLSSIACTGLGAGGTATPNLAAGSVTLDAAATAADANIVCTFTNSRQPTVALAKTWVSAATGDTATLSGIGGTGSPTLNSTANSANETDTGSAAQMAVGDVITLSETLGAGNAAGYDAGTWSCTGGSLSSNTLTLGSADVGAAIVCTIVNTRRQSDIQVTKSGSPNPVISGQAVVWTIVVGNNGPSDTVNVLLTDTPDAGQDCTAPGPTATCSASGGASCPGATVAVADLIGAGVTIPSLPVGGSVTVALECTVTATGL